MTTQHELGNKYKIVDETLFAVTMEELDCLQVKCESFFAWYMILKIRAAKIFTAWHTTDILWGLLRLGPIILKIYLTCNICDCKDYVFCVLPRWPQLMREDRCCHHPKKAGRKPAVPVCSSTGHLMLRIFAPKRGNLLGSSTDSFITTQVVMLWYYD